MQPFKQTIWPLLVAIAIYALFRRKVFLLINEHDFPTLYALLDATQARLLPLAVSLPEWVLYSLPDGLWTYGFTAYFVIRLRSTSPYATMILMLTPLLSVSIELCQLIKAFPGTFDWVDLGFILSGSILPFLIFKRHRV